MCEAFAREGHEIELIVQKRRNPITEDPFEYYSIDPAVRSKISIKHIASPDLIKYGKVGFWLQTWIFAELASIEMRKNRPDVVYSRDPIILINMILIHKNLVWETHHGDRIWWGIKLLLKKAKLIGITYGVVDHYAKYLRNMDKTLIAPDAFDPAEFDIDISREECRKKLGLPLAPKIALYWGHLYGWKGVQTFADASDFFNNYEIAVVVGGHEKDIENFKRENTGKQRLLIVGKRPRSDIALYMKAADVLVLPNTAKEKISSHFTSPLKLFEDMASGTPIVASDLPSLREILNESNAVFFTPDDPQSLAEAVRIVFTDRELARSISEKALEEVQHYTWGKRAQKIAAFIKP